MRSGPTGNPDRKCYGPYCDKVLRRFAGKSEFWKHDPPSFGYRYHPKLTPVDVIQIRKYDGPLTQVKLAAIFEVTDATIRDVRSGKSWKRLAA